MAKIYLYRVEKRWVVKDSRSKKLTNTPLTGFQLEQFVHGQPSAEFHFDGTGEGRSASEAIKIIRNDLTIMCDVAEPMVQIARKSEKFNGRSID